MNKKLVLALKLVAVFVIVPYVLGRATVSVLEQAAPSPPPPAADKAPTRVAQPQSMKQQLDRLERESAVAKANLTSVRAKTRIAVIVVGVYYVLAATVWIVLWWRRRSRLHPQAAP